MKLFFIAAIITLLTLPVFASDVPAAEPPDNVQEVSEQTLRAIDVLISSQIRPCWKIPASINKEALEAEISIDQSGNLKFIEFTNEPQPDQQELAKSVKAAIADSQCNPIKKLPPTELYYVWQNLALLFAPKN